MPTGDPLRPHSSSDPVSSPKWGASQKALLAHLQVFEGYFLFFFAVNHIPGQHLFAAFSGIHGLSSSWEKPRGFWGFPRWAVRLKEWSGLENYGSFAITALSTFHLNLQQRGHTEHQDWAPFPLHSTTTKRNSRVRALLGWVAPIPPHPPQNLIHLVSTEILGILKQPSSFPTCSNMDQEGKTPDFSPVFL